MKTSQLVQKYLDNALENNADIEQIKTLFEIYRYFYNQENVQYIPSVWSNDYYPNPNIPYTTWTVTAASIDDNTIF